MNSSVYDELVKAGAPALPDGYFYRISDRGSGMLRVEIRRRQFIGSTLIIARNLNLYGYAYPDDDGKVTCLDSSATDFKGKRTATELVAILCYDMFDQRRGILESNGGVEILRNEIKSLIGDHP